MVATSAADFSSLTMLETQRLV